MLKPQIKVYDYMTNTCFKCGTDERLIYLTREKEYICTTCYEFDYLEKGDEE